MHFCSDVRYAHAQSIGGLVSREPVFRLPGFADSPVWDGSVCTRCNACNRADSKFKSTVLSHQKN